MPRDQLFFLSPLLRALTALHMLPTLYVIDMWHILAVFYAFILMVEICSLLISLSFGGVGGVVLSVLSLPQIFGCTLMPQGSKQEEIQSSWTREQLPPHIPSIWNQKSTTPSLSAGCSFYASAKPNSRQKHCGCGCKKWPSKFGSPLNKFLKHLYLV